MADKAKEEVAPKLVTPEESVADAIAERGKFGEPPIPNEDPVQAAEETPKTEEAPESVEESATPEETEAGVEESTEETPESDDAELLDAETSEDEDKTLVAVKRGMQKRIDKITARNKELEERLAKLEIAEKAREPKKDEEKVYTDEQLQMAMKKALDEGDSQLAYEVAKELARNETRALKKEYLELQAKSQEQAKAVQKEWESVVRHYSNDDDPTVDIRNTGSTLYKVAKEFYEDQELGPLYKTPGGGGMLQATADALAEILRYRSEKKTSSEESLSKRKELNVKKRSALGGVGSLKGDDAPSRGETLEDYFADRRASVAKLKGGF